MSSDEKDPYKNFCVHPFVKMFVSTQAHMRLCCVSPSLPREVSVEKNSIESVWNGPVFQKYRNEFNQRKMPDVCRECIVNEKNGVPSHRQYENKQWKELTEFYYNNPHTTVPSPVSYDIRLSNECNLQCVMCNPMLSNQIAKNMANYNQSNQNNLYTTEYGPEKYIISDSALKQKFIDHIIDNADSTQEIWTLGGEPFVMKTVMTLIETLVKNKQSDHITLKMNSNGTVIKESWIENKLTKFKKVWIGLSLDATGDILEYVRYPSAWPVLQQKIVRLKKICDRHPSVKITLEPTVQLLNLKALPELYKFANEHELAVNPTFLDEPKQLFFGNSSQDYRLKIADQLQDYKKNDWLDWVINQPQKFLTTDEKKYFKHMVEYYDSTRPVKFLSLYPEFEFMLN